jgi:hypothetical protein
MDTKVLEIETCVSNSDLSRGDPETFNGMAAGNLR